MRDQEPDKRESTLEGAPKLPVLWRWIVSAYFSVIFVSFTFKPEALAGITALPAVAWVFLGISWILLVRFRSWVRAGKFVLICGLVVGAVTAEELYLPLRHLQHKGSGTSVAYVSLNCAGGDSGAAREAVGTGTSVVFLQESPGRVEIEALAQEFGYIPFWGPDGTVLSKVSPGADEVLTEQGFVAVRQGEGVFVSLRLIPPIFRVDYYNPELWRAQRENLRARRDQLWSILDQIDPMIKRAGEYGQVVIAGDFNAVPGQISGSDYLYHDLGSTHGVNWGGSAVNNYPLARIDRVWVSRDQFLNQFEGRVVTQMTKNSDHRMVVVYK